MLLLATLAFAAPPGPIVATPEGADAPALYKEQAVQRGEAGLRAELVCDDLTKAVVVCYRVEVGNKRRYVTRSDLAAWGVKSDELAGLAAASLDASPLKPHALDGGGTWYDAPGALGPTALVHPEWLAEIGPRVLVAIPARDALVAWRPDGGELDQVMAVGARRMFDELDHPVAPVVLLWDGTSWSEWGQASPR
ncbi:MAG: hypothetical protein GY913_25085 [Proteobacteria bacterium]|nr:hypothetical protein [Pseudomonadota bacterium]MCP4920188.1 hypothetical protein [Pseudomonadota bacterium]